MTEGLPAADARRDRGDRDPDQPSRRQIESLGGLPGRNPNGDRVIEGDTEQFIVGHQELPLLASVGGTSRDHVPAGRTTRRG